MFEQSSGGWEDGLCDVCSARKVHGVAMEFVEPGVMDRKGCWIGQLNKEKSNKWRTALVAAYQKLTARCLRIYTIDGDGGLVCKSCLLAWANTPDTSQPRPATVP